MVHMAPSIMKASVHPTLIQFMGNIFGSNQNGSYVNSTVWLSVVLIEVTFGEHCILGHILWNSDLGDIKSHTHSEWQEARFDFREPTAGTAFQTLVLAGAHTQTYSVTYCQRGKM